MKKQIILVLLALSLALLPFIFQKPASTIRSGDELTALSWVLAAHNGSGSYSLYPHSFQISTENGETVAVVEGCGRTRPPSGNLPANIPFPSEYSADGTTVTIKFSEVPENEL